MNKKLKIILSISVLVVLIIAAVLINGFQLMSIEDYYGENQKFYFESKQGDLIINRTNSKTGTIIKTWTRIYAVFDKDSVDFNELLEMNKIEIIKYNMKYDNLKIINIPMIDSLLQNGIITSIIKN